MVRATYVIVGGGIAGVSCAEGLSFLSPNQSIIMISATPTVKVVSNFKNLTELVADFDIKEQKIQNFTKSHSNVKVIQGSVKSLQPKTKSIKLRNGDCIEYEKLCICSGGKPKLIYKNDDRVIGIRDTDSVKHLHDKLSSSKRVVIVGNGGIATELVYKIRNIEVVWVIKDSYITSTFIDPGAAKFFEERINAQYHGEASDDGAVKQSKFSVSAKGRGSLDKREPGAALGPDWHKDISLQGLLKHDRKVTIEYKCELKRILPDEKSKKKEWPVYVELTNGKVIGCDFIVSATGVEPNIGFVKGSGVDLAADGGIKVDWKMESSVKDIYAAGDACTCSWELAEHWFQMRLWTQARQMGTYAAKAMHCAVNNEELWQDFCFELFTHVTSFFGMKVILLGLFNGQHLSNYEVVIRVTKGHEYVKLIMKDGVLHGAVLIGETNLEEMCENLILNQLNISDVCDGLLDPDLDVDDYFD